MKPVLPYPRTRISVPLFERETVTRSKSPSSFDRRALGSARAAIAILLAIGSPCALAQEPKIYACSFASGTAHIYDQGRFKSEPAGTMAFEIGNIDADAQTAEMATPRGPIQLKTVQAVNAIHFLEVVGEGFLNVTTLYDREDVSEPFPAVHSRHFGVLGQPVVSQFLGVCQPKR